MFLQNTRAPKYDYEQTMDGIGASKSQLKLLVTLILAQLFHNHISLSNFQVCNI